MPAHHVHLDYGIQDGGLVSLKAATIHNATLLLRELKSYAVTSCVGMKSVEKRNRAFCIVCCMDYHGDKVQWSIATRTFLGVSWPRYYNVEGVLAWGFRYGWCKRRPFRVSVSLRGSRERYVDQTAEIWCRLSSPSPRGMQNIYYSLSFHPRWQEHKNLSLT